MKHPPTAERVLRAYQSRFLAAPDYLIRAPGRVNLIGGHTDYNGGFVLPLAVDRAVWLAVGAAPGDETIIRALDMRNDEVVLPMGGIPHSTGDWSDYQRGVVWALLEAGLRPRAIRAVFASDIPVGAGMSSSAAVELAFVHAWNLLGGWQLPLRRMAHLAHQAENDYVGVRCGLLDQMACACGKEGHAMLIDMRSLELHHVPLPPQAAILVFNSGIHRSLNNSDYNLRRSECEEALAKLAPHIDPPPTTLREVKLRQLESLRSHLPDRLYRRAHHVIAENHRVLLTAAALHRGDLVTAGQLISQSHRSLRNDYEVSLPQLDLLVAEAEKAGAYGARLVGAGFGGCVLALVPADEAERIAAQVAERYAAATGSSPDTYRVHAANGIEGEALG